MVPTTYTHWLSNNKNIWVVDVQTLGDLQEHHTNKNNMRSLMFLQTFWIWGQITELYVLRLKCINFNTQLFYSRIMNYRLLPPCKYVNCAIVKRWQSMYLCSCNYIFCPKGCERLKHVENWVKPKNLILTSMEYIYIYIYTHTHKYIYVCVCV
jgi:hypothetical protein